MFVSPATSTSRQSILLGPIDNGGHVVAQFLRSLQRSLDPDNLHLARRDLPRRFPVTARSHQAALMASQHSPKERHCTFLRLRMRAAKADQSLRTMLSSGQGAEVRAHDTQVAARSEGGPQHVATRTHEHPPECGPTVVQSRCSGVFPMTLCRSRLLGDVKSLR